MKAILELELTKQLENEDVLVYRDGKLINIPKKEYLHEITEMKELLKSEIIKNEEFKIAVNEKLKTYHNILRVLTDAKEEV